MKGHRSKTVASYARSYRSGAWQPGAQDAARPPPPVELEQTFEDFNGFVFGDRAFDLDNQGFGGELVDKVQEPQAPAVGSLVILEIQCPGVGQTLVRVCGLQGLRLSARSLAISLLGELKSGSTEA